MNELTLLLLFATLGKCHHILIFDLIVRLFDFLLRRQYDCGLITRLGCYHFSLLVLLIKVNIVFKIG